MHASLVTVAIVGSLLAAEDRAKLQGTWKLIAMSTKGMDDSKEAADIFRAFHRIPAFFVFDGNQADCMVGKDIISKWAYRIDAMKHPKEMDMCISYPTHPNRSAVVKAIYSLEGDTLKLCYDLETHPKKFATEPNSEAVLMVLKRKTP